MSIYELYKSMLRSATCSFSFIGPGCHWLSRACGGFGTVTNAAEECVNPHRDLPIGITVSLLICALLQPGFKAFFQAFRG